MVLLFRCDDIPADFLIQLCPVLKSDF